MNVLFRFALVAVGIALVGWVSLGIYRAGGDVPAPARHPITRLTAGHAEGRRIDGKPSWSLDYDRLTASDDTTIATLENVRHGEIYRHGRPFMRIRAAHVVVNTLSNDFIVTGPLELIEDVPGGTRRRLTSDAANYSGVLQTLALPHPADIASSTGTSIKVASATVNFRSGDIVLGRMLGFVTGDPR